MHDNGQRHNEEKKTICRQAPTVQECQQEQDQCQQEQDQCQQEQDQCQQEQDQGPPVPETKISFDSAGRGRR